MKFKGALKKLIMVMMMVVTIAVLPAMNTYAANSVAAWDERDDSETITDKDREMAYIMMIEHINSIKAMYDLSDGAVKRIDDVSYEANVYIANTQMTVGQLKEYLEGVKASITAAAGDASLVSSTKEFLFLSNDVGISSGTYNSTCTINLSVVNLGKEDVTDVVITPHVSTDPKEWPFRIKTASDARKLERVPASDTVDESLLNKRNASWVFVVSDEALSGIYPVKFDVQYYRNGNIEQTELVTYANITGAPGNGKLAETAGKDGISTPRIIVTGFSTDPEVVKAGESFNLKINVQNTSATTTVSNIQFDIKAAVESTEGNSGIEAFLPTSGSSTIYVENIEPGAETTLEIEMTARNDLAQKPYVVSVKALYEDEANNSFNAEADVSIPVTQNARVETSDAEVMPSPVSIGESANVMFDIYNLGKTTLYNVKVSFDDGYLSGGNGFIGKIEAGGTGSVDVMPVGAMANDETGIVTATISYEDEMGNISTIEKEIVLSVMDFGGDMYGEGMYDEGMYDEGMYDDGMYGDGMYGDMPAKKGGSIIVIIIAVVVVGGIVAFVIVRKNKKKAALLKEQQELEKELAAEIEREQAAAEAAEHLASQVQYYTEDGSQQTSDSDNNEV